jgi:chemotaxis protein MotB
MSNRRNRGGGGGGHGGGGGEERWLLPYADMITLLLGLFIVLFAMSSVDAKKFDDVRRSLAQTFTGAVLTESGSVLPGSNGVLDPTAPSQATTDAAVTIDEATRRSRERFDVEARKLENMAAQLGLGKDVDVMRTEVGIEISIAGDALFDSGSYRLSSPGIRDKLTAIERELERFGSPIRIEGHTDGALMRGEFGNDGLSAMRALAVQKFLVDLGFPYERTYVVGLGAKQPKVPPPSPTASVRENRRIEIIVLEPGADDPRPTAAQRVSAINRAASMRGGSTGRRPANPGAAAVQDQLDREFSDVLVSELSTVGRGT